MIGERLKILGRRLPFAYRGFLLMRSGWRKLRREVVQVTVPFKRLGRKSENHALPAPLVVSLTSYPARFGTLHLTLISILSQSVEPDRTVLWIAHDDMSQLPHAVLELKKRGLEIEPCDELWSYKKIVPALNAFPATFIVTADDDVYYPRNWLSALVESYKQSPAAAICHRAHRLRLDDDGQPRRYSDWGWNVAQETESPFIVPTSGAGVLYAPGAFYRCVGDVATFLTLSPTTDDLWLYWMLRLNGGEARVLKGRRPVVTWRGSQTTSLANDNLGEKSLNDRAVRALVEKFGFPRAGSARAKATSQNFSTMRIPCD